MLEYGFNELDNDFVTLWSKKIVSGEDSLIFEDLTKLAELGQINAIQSWYLLAKRGDDNEVIDNNVDNLGNGGANELLAIAHKDFFKNNRLNQMSEFYFLKTEWDRTEAQDVRMKEVKYALMRSDYISKLETSTEMYYHNYANTLNWLMMERYYEMIAARTEILDEVQGYGIKISKRKLKKLRGALLELYEEDKSNVAVAYALGKNLILFKSSIFQRAMGSQILTELSNRELSKTLQNYAVKGTKRLIKQQIDLNAQAEVQNLSAEDRHVQEVFESVEKSGIKFKGDHRVGALTKEQTLGPLTSEQVGIVDKNSNIVKATQKFNELDAQGRTTVIKPNITEQEVEEVLESVTKHDTEHGQLL